MTRFLYMRAHWKKWLIGAALLIIILKFREQIVAVVKKVPVVGTFVG